jgi:hypothetical protein
MYKLYWDNNRLTVHQLEAYARTMEELGRVRNVCGFIDGTISRPSNVSQQFFYSGYKIAHTLKFQGIMTPDDLVSHVSGPFGDWAAWQQFEIENVHRTVFAG